jgi:uroporphyrinogen-III synthase
MRLIVTRPAAQAADWVRELVALGLDARALPLIAIEALDDLSPLHASWHALPGVSLVVFVSANAVQQFFAARPPTAGWPDAALAGSTGPGTSAVLRAAGVDGRMIVEPAGDAPTLDSEALWARLQGRDWQGRRVLVVRGEDGRDWLADALRERGAELQFLAAYRRRVPALDAPALALLAAAQAEPAQHLWLFSSSEAVTNLRGLAPRADWSRSRAFGSHPRVAQAAREAGFGQVEWVPSTPATVARRAVPCPPLQSAPL